MVLKMLTICLMLTLLAVTVSRTCALCSPIDTRWSSYVATPAPGMFEGQSTACSSTCLGPLLGGFGKLADGNLGTQTLNGTFDGHAWDQTVSINFIFGVIASVSGINLYFYNIPSRGIGLPYNIKITSSTFTGDNPYLLESNSNLTLEDTGLQTVTLTPQSLSLLDNPNNVLTIEFEFSDTDQINLLLLTEVEVCTSQSAITLPDPPPSITFSSDTLSAVSPTNITSSITLTCSVTEGRFDWTWTQPPNPTPTLTTQQLVLNAGRTSVLELSGLSSEDEGTYQCQATHTFGTMPSATFNIQLSLQDALRAESTSVDVTASDEIAILRCFLYGYLPSGEEPSINWREANANRDIANDSVNSITVESGDKLIQNGGAQSVPSLTSTLTVNLTSSPLTTAMRLYTCSSSQTTDAPDITLTSTGPPPVTSSEPPVTSSEPLSSNPDTTDLISTGSEAPAQTDNSIIIGAIVAVIVFLIIAMVVANVAVIMIIVRRTKRVRNVVITEHNDHTVQVSENEAYGIKPNTFNMTQNTMYGTGHAEELTEDGVENEYEELDSVAVTLRSPPS